MWSFEDGEGARQGKGERWHYLYQESALPPAHSTDTQGLVQRVGGVRGEEEPQTMIKGLCVRRRDYPTIAAKKRHRRTRMMVELGRSEEGLICRRTVVMAWFVCCLTPLASVSVGVRCVRV
jgi:hypothetical protein